MAITLTVILTVAVIAMLFLLVRNRTRPTRTRQHHRSESAQPASNPVEALQQKKIFWGMELKQPGCTESWKLLGRQFSFEDAPALPVEGCTHERCKCVFEGLRDRRVNPRRVSPDRRGDVRFDKSHPDRRTHAGRRRGDLWRGHTI